jgi:hypothetical protein
MRLEELFQAEREIEPMPPISYAEIAAISERMRVAAGDGREAQVAEGVLVNTDMPRLLDEIERLQAAREVARLKEIEGFWHTSCEHVKEALELMGVDVTVAGFVPDTWTLREQCHIKAGEIERLRGLLKKSFAYAGSRDSGEIILTRWEDSTIDAAK